MAVRALEKLVVGVDADVANAGGRARRAVREGSVELVVRDAKLVRVADEDAAQPNALDVLADVVAAEDEMPSVDAVHAEEDVRISS